jgi:hypothetical protein
MCDEWPVKGRFPASTASLAACSGQDRQENLMPSYGSHLVEKIVQLNDLAMIAGPHTSLTAFEAYMTAAYQIILDLGGQSSQAKDYSALAEALLTLTSHLGPDDKARYAEALAFAACDDVPPSEMGDFIEAADLATACDDLDASDTIAFEVY